jgi:Spy/CpxP family protein refolding chaperone
VTSEQWKQIEPHMREFMEKMADRQERISEVRYDMLDLLFSEDVSPEAIEKQQDEVLTAFRKTQDLVLEHVLTEKRYLTPAQERKLKEMLEERVDTSGPGNPPIGRTNEKRGRGVGKALEKLETKPPNQE